MLELYVKCPTTGEPVYAGFQSQAGQTVPTPFIESNCPACGAKHNWRADAVWSAIQVTVPSYEAA